MIVIGLPRNKKRYIQSVIRSKYITNWRIQKVFKPAVLKRMAYADAYWWGNTDQDKEAVLAYVKGWNPAGYERIMQKLKLKESE